ncbi:extracellular solute-binding protein [Agrobacterium tumefaciens]|uniref:extracellular solute-binding protein n=1 Tax=Agrobacterium tumefaciens TaxID=358 RepID=UPI0021FC3D4C|nr:extracellular solute-binding protein [Agrobacterium tumefaciens]
MKRRTFLQSTAAIALAAPFVSKASAAQATVTLASYGGVVQQKYQSAVIEPFQKANPDIKVEYYQMNNSAQNLGTLRGQKSAPQVDLSILDVTVAKGGTDEGIFKPVTASEVPNIADLYPQAIFEGVAGVGVMFDSLPLVYAPDRAPKKPASWMDLAGPEFRRQFVIGGVPSLDALALLFILSGQKPEITDYAGAVEAGMAAWEKIAPNVLTWDPRPDAAALVIGKGASVGASWNARAQAHIDAAPGKLVAVVPAEGTALQINVINLVNGAPNEKAALQFMNYALGAEAQKAFTEAMYYAPTNKNAKISPEALSRTVASQMEKVVSVDWIKVAGMRDGIIKQWQSKVLKQ